MMNENTAVSYRNYRLWLLLILLTAACLRLAAITEIPPGLTHDEVDHGVTAWEIVNGARAIYFTVGYGREPLYDYAMAAIMSLIGPTYLAARVTAVYLSLILIAGMTAWVRRAFSRSTALLTAAGLAVGFWPVMAGRQALRSITLPALFVLALVLWWRGMAGFMIKDSRLKAGLRSSIFDFIAAGLFLGATFYTYIPARIMWAIFPAALIYAAWRQRPFLRRAWRGTALMLLIAFAVASPLIYFLSTHPEVEVRIDELSVPLAAAAAGDFDPLLDNALASLRLFTVEGDRTWRYNLSGRPFLQPVMGGLFYLGAALALWGAIAKKDREGVAGFLSLVWLVAGFSPVLVTGPELSMTQAIGMQPVLYLFPALALVGLGEGIERRGGGEQGSGGVGSLVSRRAVSFLSLFLPLLLFGVTAVITVRDYFGVWANEPEVRVQYEATMVAAMTYLNEFGEGAAAVSTITPGRYHSPAVAQMTLHNDAVDLHWFDARHSLLLPASDDSVIILPGFTPLSPALVDYFATAVLAESLPLRPTDPDRPLAIYHVNGETMRAEWRSRFNTLAGPTKLGDGATFLGYDLQTPAVQPGDPIVLATLWQVERPLAGAILFTHLLGPDGRPIAQADRLDVPGESWQRGDWFIQLHELTIPEETAVGEYPLTIGLYTCIDAIPCPDGQRVTAPTGDDHLVLTTLNITQ